MRFILRRLGFYLVAFWASVTLNFLLPRFMPGDPVSRMMSQSQGRMSPSRSPAAQLFGLDDARCWEQYLDYWKSVFTGAPGGLHLPLPDPGHRGHRQPDRLDAAARRHRADHRGHRRQPPRDRRGLAARRLPRLGLPAVLVFLGSFPYFWLAMGALYLFGVVLGWFPLRHAFTAGLTPGCPANSSSTSPRTWCCRR